ncbi:MAG: hypothetical protein KF680_03565 [Cryobacterium sp.]|nr:hypothetical protein [Cryobacterium sp.]
MPIEIQVALITLGGVLFGSLLRFLTSLGSEVVRIARDAGEQFRSSRKLHKKYSNPLVHASLALMFRLEELVAERGRDCYLQTKLPRTSFETYKAASTLYRLATLLA